MTAKPLWQEPAAPALGSELKRPTALQEAINTALKRGHPMSIAYISADGPETSFRGRLQTYGDTKRTIWIRTPDGGLLRAVRAGKVPIAALYDDP